jgi:hypothetical protein
MHRRPPIASAQLIWQVVAFAVVPNEVAKIRCANAALRIRWHRKFPSLFDVKRSLILKI